MGNNLVKEIYLQFLNRKQFFFERKYSFHSEQNTNIHSFKSNDNLIKGTIINEINKIIICYSEIGVINFYKVIKVTDNLIKIIRCNYNNDTISNLTVMCKETEMLNIFDFNENMKQIDKVDLDKEDLEEINNFIKGREKTIKLII